MAELGFVLALDDGEGGEDVGGGVAGEAVEVEVEGVEAGSEVAAFFFAPGAEWAVVAGVLGEGGTLRKVYFNNVSPSASLGQALRRR